MNEKRNAYFVLELISKHYVDRLSLNVNNTLLSLKETSFNAQSIDLGKSDQIRQQGVGKQAAAINFLFFPLTCILRKTSGEITKCYGHYNNPSYITNWNGGYLT
ncbi:hypothetical protein NPIL_439101 [Nephila pilipes]|uniref:Uncharacterized protein n=1 Tax=Nephila pilipes TaxID=299642 RepID=A0A8X6QEA3_NEPPI|nr:hypothetical protein NPIL_439101 [Nephila pilipes]